MSLSLAVGHSCGASVTSEGDLEIMLARNLAQDDGRGLSQPNGDTANFRVYRRLSFSSVEETQRSLKQRSLSLNNWPEVFLVNSKNRIEISNVKKTNGNISIDEKLDLEIQKYLSAYPFSTRIKFLSQEFPGDKVHLLSVYPRDFHSKDTVIRLINLNEMGANDDAPARISLAKGKIFTEDLDLGNVRARTLSHSTPFHSVLTHAPFLVGENSKSKPSAKNNGFLTGFFAAGESAKSDAAASSSGQGNSGGKSAKYERRYVVEKDLNLRFDAKAVLVNGENQNTNEAGVFLSADALKFALSNTRSLLGTDDDRSSIGDLSYSPGNHTSENKSLNDAGTAGSDRSSSSTSRVGVSSSPRDSGTSHGEVSDAVVATRTLLGAEDGVTFNISPMEIRTFIVSLAKDKIELPRRGSAAKAPSTNTGKPIASKEQVVKPSESAGKEEKPQSPKEAEKSSKAKESEIVVREEQKTGSADAKVEFVEEKLDEENVPKFVRDHNPIRNEVMHMPMFNRGEAHHPGSAEFTVVLVMTLLGMFGVILGFYRFQKKRKAQAQRT